MSASGERISPRLEVTAAAATVDSKVTVDNDSKADATSAVRRRSSPIDAMTIAPARRRDDRDAGRLITIAAGKTDTVETKRASPIPSSGASKTPEPLRRRHHRRSRTAQSSTPTKPPSASARSSSTPTHGFSINGKHVKLNGVCDHHDLGALGTAVNVRALQRQLEILSDMGCNAIRTSHNPPAPELLDLCDQWASS